MLVSGRAPGAGVVPAHHWRTGEAITWRLTVTPGTIRVGTRKVGHITGEDENPDTWRRAFAWEAHDTEVQTLLPASGQLAEVMHVETRGPSRSEVTEWSRKSRAHMVEVLASLDYRPLFQPMRSVAMVTLTLPGDWLTVAPTGRAFKRLIERFKTRYFRAWGERIRGVWKLEFQRRGAPHLHILMAPPPGVSEGHGRRDKDGKRAFEGLPFRQWLSATWADVVAHPDPDERARHEQAGTGVDYAEGQKATDPKRIAVYFVKHATPGGAASKEYQHIVPAEWQGPGDGPGRFWGVWDLETVERTVELSPEEAITAARILRRYSRAQQTTRAVRVYRPKVDRQTGEIRDAWRRSHVRAVRMQSGRGFICLNNAPSMVAQLSRYLDQLREDEETGAYRALRYTKR